MGNTVEIDKEILERAYSLYRSVKSADYIYKPCQDKPFRQYVKSALDSQNVRDAFSHISKLIEGGV